MYKYSLSYPRALYKIQLDLPKIKESVEIGSEYTYIKDKKLIQTVLKQWDSESLKYWSRYGISQATLDTYNVNSVKSVYINKELSMR